MVDSRALMTAVPKEPWKAASSVAAKAEKRAGHLEPLMVDCLESHSVVSMALQLVGSRAEPKVAEKAYPTVESSANYLAA